jgi:hypothetical protein
MGYSKGPPDQTGGLSFSPSFRHPSITRPRNVCRLRDFVVSPASRKGRRGRGSMKIANDAKEEEEDDELRVNRLNRKDSPCSNPQASGLKPQAETKKAPDLRLRSLKPSQVGRSQTTDRRQADRASGCSQPPTILACGFSEAAAVNPWPTADETKTSRSTNTLRNTTRRAPSESVHPVRCSP